MPVKRGQVGVEYIMLVALLLVFLIPIVSYSLNESSYRIKVSQIENTISRVTKAANAVYALGPGSQDIVLVAVPQGVEGVEIAKNSVSLNVSLFGGISQFGYTTVGPVAGTLPIQPGTYRILVYHTSAGVVNISLKS